MPIKPKKVLCKRTEINGKNHWWDDSVTPPVRHERDNRMFVAGQWYDVVDNPNDIWDEEKRDFTFSVMDSEGDIHLHYMYDEQDKSSWPSFCTKYGPRDYSKWFCTPEEIELFEKGEFKPREDINIKPGNYHWVKTHEGEWIIAFCRADNVRPHKFNWQVHGSIYDKMDEDFLDIGEQVISLKQQKRDKEKEESVNELLDELFILTDSINKNDPNGNYAPVEYIMPFVNKATDKYFESVLNDLADVFKSNKED